jgi:poly(A)-specific ribonuclease
MDPLHVKYSSQELHHEAGFDSMLTATAFLKLSAMLSRGSFDRNKIKQHEQNGGMRRPQQGRSPVERSPRDFFAAENVKSLDMIANGWLHTRGSTLEETGSAEVAHKVRNGELIPRLGSEFWNVYSNRLRAFGTKERMVQLGIQEQKEEMLMEFD